MIELYLRIYDPEDNQPLKTQLFMAAHLAKVAIRRCGVVGLLVGRSSTAKLSTPDGKDVTVHYNQFGEHNKPRIDVSTRPYL